MMCDSADWNGKKAGVISRTFVVVMFSLPWGPIPEMCVCEVD